MEFAESALETSMAYFLSMPYNVYTSESNLHIYKAKNIACWHPGHQYSWNLKYSGYFDSIFPH